MSAADHSTPGFLDRLLPESQRWAAAPQPTDLATLPSIAALYLLIDANDTPVLLATTQHLRHVLLARLTDTQRRSRGRADLAQVTRGVRWRPLSTAFEARWWYYRGVRELHPDRYRKLMSFGPAYFLNADWTQRVPELRVTERVWCVPGEFVGPWATQKAAHEALAGLWDLFDLCRYPEQVRRAPRGTRCAYAEMGRCDAPCDGSAPLEVYAGRCRAAWNFAYGAVGQWLLEANERMKRAAAEQRYELAGQVKGQIQFAQTWLTRWAPHVRPAEQLNYLLCLPVTRRRAWKLVLFRQGSLIDGPAILERKLVSEAPVWLSVALATVEDLPAEVRMEQTWLVAQWLLGRQRETSVVVPLRKLEVPGDFGAVLAEGVAERSRRRGGGRGPRSEDEPPPMVSEAPGQ